MEVFLYCTVVGDTFARVLSFEVCTATLSYTYGFTGKVGESVADNRAVKKHFHTAVPQ
jgi:hypothetical protein